MTFSRATHEQQAFFPDAETRRPALPIRDDQSDIRYFGTFAKSVLNRPETTGMNFWSINPYVGCALGCAYCYARYAHGYAFERVWVPEILARGFRKFWPHLEMGFGRPDRQGRDAWCVGRARRA